jgi:hypothetical protein
VIGELIYRLNVSRPVVRMMYRRHVFTDPASLTDDLLAERLRVPAGPAPASPRRASSPARSTRTMIGQLSSLLPAASRARY